MRKQWEDDRKALAREQDWRTFRLIESLSAWLGRKDALDHVEIFPSLKGITISAAPDDDVDPEVSFDQVTAMLRSTGKM